MDLASKPSSDRKRKSSLTAATRQNIASTVTRRERLAQQLFRYAPAVVRHAFVYVLESTNSTFVYSPNTFYRVALTKWHSGLNIKHIARRGKSITMLSKLKTLKKHLCTRC